MQKRSALTTALLLVVSAPLVACSGGFSPAQTGEVQGHLRTSSAQSRTLKPGELPKFNSRAVNMGLNPLDRAIALLKGTAGELPSGTRIYASDVFVVRDGKHITLPSRTQTVSKRPDGSVVLLNSQGQLVQVFPASATIQVQKDAQVQAVLPGRQVPKRFERSTPIEVIP